MTVAAVGLAAIAFLSALAKADNAAEATYKAKCAMCRGPDDKGDTATRKTMKVKDFASDEVQKMSDADLTDSVRKGKSKMPPYKTLTPDQVTYASLLRRRRPPADIQLHGSWRGVPRIAHPL
jgi:hypothetical protein